MVNTVLEKITEEEYNNRINSIAVVEDEVKDELFNLHDDEWMAYEPDSKKILSHDVNRKNCLKKAMDFINKLKISLNDIQVIVISRTETSQSKITMNYL